MEFQKPSIKPIAFTYGLYLALVSIAMAVIMYVLNVQKSWAISIISTVLTVAIIVYAIKVFKQKNNGFLSLGDAIKVGLAVSVIGGLIGAIYAYIHYTYVFPEFIDMTLDQARIQISESSPNMSEEQVEQAVEYSRMFTSPGFFSLMSIVGSLFFGIIISLIAGLIMKKENTHGY